MAALKISPKAFRVPAPKTPTERIKEFLSAIAPEKKTLAAIRAAARKNGKSKISRREIDREIQLHRRGRSL
ncbi:MAG: hypothetical protein WA254_23570 [Candidatus Sulfotelmatobacter sp.]